MIPEQNNQSFNFNVPPGTIPQVIPSEHSQAIACVCVSQLKDLLVTCGEDGEMHLYRLFEQTGEDEFIRQPEKIGYCAVFDDPIICADWGKNFNRPFIAVGSAAGQIAILRVYPKTNLITIEQKIPSIKDTAIACTQIVWALNKRTFLVATSDKLCFEVTFNNEYWEKTSSNFLENPAPISVAYHPNNQSYVLIANFNQISLNEIVDNRFIVLKSENVGASEPIKRILYSNEYPCGLNQFVILTNSSILICEDISEEFISKIKQRNASSIQSFHFTRQQINEKFLNIRQQIDLNKLELHITDISWGNDQTQIMCYESPRQKEQTKQSSNIEQVIIKPKRMVLDLCGEWSFSSNLKSQ